MKSSSAEQNIISLKVYTTKTAFMGQDWVNVLFKRPGNPLAALSAIVQCSCVKTWTQDWINKSSLSLKRQRWIIKRSKAARNPPWYGFLQHCWRFNRAIKASISLVLGLLKVSWFYMGYTFNKQPILCILIHDYIPVSESHFCKISWKCLFLNVFLWVHIT